MKAPAPIKAHVRGSRHQSCNENCNSLPETKLDDRIHPQ